MSITDSIPDGGHYRTKTERVEAALVDVLHGGRDPALTEVEQRLYEELAAEVRMGKMDVDGELWRLDYIKEPPNVEQFLLDDYFLGRTWRHIEGENEGMWPAWLEIFKQYLDFESRIHNMVITGSLGIGKTSMAVTALLYRIAIATYLKNPVGFFGLSRNSNIVYNVLSVTKEQVMETAFGNALAYMGDSPYFVEVCKFNPDMKYSGYHVPMLNTLPDGSSSRIWLTAGSKGQHVLGRNLIGVCLDEGNFRLEKDPDLAAYDLYDQVRTRISNRFQKIASYLPALSVIASSAADESSFTEKICSEIEQHNKEREESNAKIDNPQARMPLQQMVFRHAIYKIKRHALPAIGPDHEWFKVAYGLKNMEPFILAGWYKEDGTPLGEEPHEQSPNGTKTELVPRLYYDEYRRNCKTKLQDISGISVSGAHRLFPSLVDIEECLTLSKQEKVPDPLQPGIQRIPISADDDKNIWDYLNHKSFLTRVMSRVQPLRHPYHQRYAHLDLATQTQAGLAICHLAGTQLVEGLVRDGEPFSEYRLIIEYDFILSIIAGPTKPINLEKIQRFFFWLRDMCGYRFGIVTADMYESAMPLQMLDGRGFETDRLSIDKDKSVYHAWRAGFEEHRIRLHRNEMMLHEAEQLLEVDKKYDHPANGSKDITDAAAGAFWNAISADEKITMMSHNVPSIYSGQTMDTEQKPGPPVEITLPSKGYTRSKVFDV